MLKRRSIYWMTMLWLVSSLASGGVLARGETAVPPHTPAAATNFPVGAAETYKIELNQDGIYAISGAELAAAGMDIANVNPATLAMMHRGQPVAYQFVGDADAVFEPGEIVRFYGWAFDGPRTDKQFITNNVFWLWAGGTPTNVATTTNQSGGQVTTSTMATVTAEPENYFFSTWTDDWDSFPNEPDSWYWDFVVQTADVLTKTYPITLPHPDTDTAGPDATYWIELFSRNSSTHPSPFNYQVRGYMNDDPSYGEQSWGYIASVNITNTIPATAITPGDNQVKVVFATDHVVGPNIHPQVYLNRITVQYQRQLIADGDRLLFGDETGGSRQFQVGGFSDGAAANALVWNVTDPTQPVQVAMTAGHISGSGSYTYHIGSTHAAGATFMATTTANLLPAAAISRYAPTGLEPPAGGADWVAISHANFIAQAETLAAHRAAAAFGDLATWVVDYEDVINQYGYGLPLPAAIRDYLAHAVGSWSPAPEYAVLFGSATLNPRHLDCQHWSCPGDVGDWDKDQPTFVVTDLVYEDRWQGLIPSDHTMALLTGNDLIPDIAIGRITADTAAGAGAAVAKIILYEQNQLAGVTGQRNLLFVADNADGGGNFYAENQITAANHIPDGYPVTQRYLLTNTQAETDTLRDVLKQDVNDVGAAIVNYRGHGWVDAWADPSILSSDDLDFWDNASKPTVILSADCLDGNFAFPGLSALSKTFLTLQNNGTAAHWSSTGLGYTFEHSVLHRAFYDGLFEQELMTIGAAVNYAKLIYQQSGYDDSELYSFLLQGDPAMVLFPLRQQTYLPVVLSQ